LNFNTAPFITLGMMSKWCSMRPADIIDPDQEEIRGAFDRYFFDLGVIGAASAKSQSSSGSPRSVKEQVMAQKEELARQLRQR